jgi:hypothetical protein
MKWQEVPTWAKEVSGGDCLPTTHHPDDYNDLFRWLLNQYDVPPEVF